MSLFGEEHTLLSDAIEVFHQVCGDLPFTLKFVEEVDAASNPSIYGMCNFSKSPPEISIRKGLAEVELIDTVIHELAHLACGQEAGHNELWERCRDDIHVRLAALRFEALGG